MDIPTSINIFGITFHLYGLIIGLSLILLWKISENFLFGKISKNVQSTLFIWLIISALIGARLWHIATDWELYRDNLMSVFFVWQGGLSIFGALLGGLIGIVAASKVHKFTWDEILHFADAMAIAMPFAQAAGRVANWINEELYGPPTDVPWKIYISEPNRLRGFENQEFYHPLFLYETIGNLFLGFVLSFLERRSHLRFGQGKILLLYLFCYGVLRFFLDFMRLDKTMIPGVSLGLNQILILIALLALLLFWLFKWFSIEKAAIVVFLIAGSFMALSGYLKNNEIKEIENKPKIFGQLTVRDQTLEVEIANTAEKITLGLSGRDQIGADGMLFILAEPRQPGFWMKEMKFDLDIIWIKDNKIVGIHKNVPAPAENTPESKLEVYFAPEPIDMILEVPAGTSDQYNWQSGETLYLML